MAWRSVPPLHDPPLIYRADLLEGKQKDARLRKFYAMRLASDVERMAPFDPAFLTELEHFPISLTRSIPGG